MKQTNLFAHLRRLLWYPRQIIITDAHSQRAARKLHIRPLSVVLLLGLIIGGAYLAGIARGSDQDHRGQQARITSLQHEKARLSDRLAEAKAMLNLRDEQIAGLRDEIKKLHQQQRELRNQVEMFSNILEARKRLGVHLLHMRAHWQKDQAIAYSFVLVKGGNYPRVASGHIRFSTIDPEGQSMPLALPGGEPSLPYQTKSHTFIQGTLPWNKPWRPDTLRITLLDREGKEIETRKIHIDG